MMTAEELLKISYKKLKSSVFYDKTQLPLRDKIVLFEAQDEFDDILKELAVEIDYKEKFGKHTQAALDGVGCFSLPKSLQGGKPVQGTYLNVANESVVIEKRQYSIDMSVVGHILGVAWVLLVGAFLDKEISENSYGNRLKVDLLREDNMPSNSPYLFEPYFSQYESWRDKGLEQAKKMLTNNKSVIMMTLDFSRFFYSVNIDEENLRRKVSTVLQNNHLGEKLTGVAWFLTDFVMAVIKKYSGIVRNYDADLVGSRNILPIGFAPSNVLSNVYLKNFDDTIINGWNPTYYGRYVDDVLIIDKVEVDSPMYAAAADKTLCTQKAIDYFLAETNFWIRKVCDNATDVNNGLLIKETNDEEINYKINDEFLYFKGGEVKLQNKKAKVFYFDSSQSDILIQCFQKNLQNNVSEFRYLPGDEPVFNNNDYTEIYKISEQSGPNKLNGVEEVSLDKFDLSKFLGKYMRISGLINDKRESRFNSDITKIFTPDATIENYSVWEKIFTVFAINENFKELGEFVGVILGAIEKIEIAPENFRDNAEINLMKTSLLRFMYSGLNRSLSLIWGKTMTERIYIIEKKIDDSITNQNLALDRKTGISEFRRLYCLSRMCDKYAMPILIDELIHGNKFCLDDRGETVNLTSLTAVINRMANERGKEHFVNRRKKYKYYPYIITVMDLTFANMVDSLVAGKPHEINCNPDDLKACYDVLNFNSENSNLSDSHKIFAKTIKERDIKKSFVKVGTRRTPKLKIAVANTELPEKLLEDLLQNTFDRSYDRYNRMVNMFNESLKEQADMIVFPEGFLPVEWLPILARTCAKNQMAAVVGLEHFTVCGTVYNITATILPYSEKDYKYAYIHFHLKTHYAPHERETIESRGRKIIEGKEYTLFNWNDVWFAVYCCYELTSIKDRALFSSYADAVIAVEWNMDVNYYNNIIESLSRDIHCYCVQVNMSKYGDSRITQPSKTEKKDLLRVKGGKNSIVLLGELDIDELRKFQLSGNIMQFGNDRFKMTPPDFDMKIVQQKKDGTLWGNLIL